jgi:hypothetical protein
VAEFLQTQAIWEELLTLTNPRNFDVNLSLLGAYLIETKTYPSNEVVDTRKDPIWRSMRACLQYGRLTEVRQCLRTAVFMDELDAAMTHHWNSTREFHTEGMSYFPESINGSESVHWATSVFRPTEGFGDLPEYSEADQSIYSLAAGSGLVHYLKEKLSRAPHSITSEQAQQSILAAISAHARNFERNSLPISGNSFADS